MKKILLIDAVLAIIAIVGMVMIAREALHGFTWFMRHWMRPGL